MKKIIVNAFLLITFATATVNLIAQGGRNAVAAEGKQSSGGKIRTNSRMIYHNGQIMPLASHVYIIWYGHWSTRPGTVEILTRFIISIGGSPYALINTTYPDANGLAPNGGFIYGGSIDDLYSHGSTLSEADVADIVVEAFESNALPHDTRGIYLVLASPDVTAEGFCTQRCQFHDYSVPFGSHVKYAFVGNPDRCPESCASQFSGAAVTPNGDRAADAMASWIAHVLNETVTNPAGNAWYDRNGLENSDKCVGTFGQTYITATGAVANMLLGGRDYLIQQNWINEKKGRCGLSYP